MVEREETKKEGSTDRYELLPTLHGNVLLVFVPVHLQCGQDDFQARNKAHVSDANSVCFYTPSIEAAILDYNKVCVQIRCLYVLNLKGSERRSAARLRQYQGV